MSDIKFFLLRVGALFLLLVLVFVGEALRSPAFFTTIAIGLLIVAVANFWAKPNTMSSLVPAAQCFAFSGATFALSTTPTGPYWSAAHIASLVAAVLSAVVYAVAWLVRRQTRSSGPTG